MSTEVNELEQWNGILTEYVCNVYQIRVVIYNYAL